MAKGTGKPRTARDTKRGRERTQISKQWPVANNREPGVGSTGGISPDDARKCAQQTCLILDRLDAAHRTNDDGVTPSKAFGKYG